MVAGTSKLDIEARSFTLLVANAIYDGKRWRQELNDGQPVVQERDPAHSGADSSYSWRSFWGHVKFCGEAASRVAELS